MRLSVCMATFNGASFLEAQISSIIKQLNASDQLVIVDDGSTDNTLDIIRGFNDPRIELSINTVNLGAAPTFGRALNLAKGDVIFLSDQDDRWHDEKVATVVKMFETSDLDLLVHDAVVMRDKQVLHASLFEVAGSSPGVIKNIVSNTFTGCCMAFRRDLLRDVLPISSHIGIYHDAWIGVLAQYFGYKVAFESVPLIDFIRHGSNASTLRRRGIVPIVLERIVFLAALALQIGRVSFRRLIKRRDVI